LKDVQGAAGISPRTKAQEKGERTEEATGSEKEKARRPF